MLAVFAVVFGVCYGAYVALLPTIVMDLYGPRSVSGIIGCLYTGCGRRHAARALARRRGLRRARQLPAADRSPARLFSCRRRGLRRDPAARWPSQSPPSRLATRAACARLHVGGEAIQSAMRLGDPVRARARLHALHDGVPAVPSRAARGADDRPGRRLARQVLLQALAARLRSAWSSSIRACVAAAREHFALPPDDARFRVEIGDGAEALVAGVLRRAGGRRLRGRAARAAARERASSTTARSSRSPSRARWW